VLVTDRRRLCPGCPEHLACLLEQVRHAVSAGIDMVQIRERDLEGRALASLVRDAVSLSRGTATRILVNDRLDVALAAGADGVHLRGDSMPAAAARRLAPRPFVVGRSVHTPAEAAAAGDDVDYVLAGTVAVSASKASGHTLLGFDGLAAIVARAAAPVVAIGGLGPESAPLVARAGAKGVAGIGAFMSAGPDKRGCRAAPLDTIAAALRARLA
jgi:thiamine-phosphate pyrophosphorylase